ncbi:Acyl-CoA dehydrogenase [Fusarium oxysporum f. sp. cubense race 1]|uniref:Acyl-CoA dehydrogenase n=1 Tax=Fusarium oxysporum f. sp. cubense (strain race 1) TaxID=1229664 RepID=N4U4H6_FUSC1|nr:Acyl-CoA dehydrogenase [Fusarium oxysporum f. sp. cubense race 1]
MNLYMCATRYHLSSHPEYGGGVSLANDLQSEHSIVGNMPFVILIYHYGTEKQKQDLIPASISGQIRATFGLTEINHGTSGKVGDASGITAFLVPRNSPGITVASYEWTLNMPTDHATVLFKDVLVPASAILGPRDNGLAIAQTFTHENRIRQAASSCGAARYCIQKSVEYANNRNVFGKPLSINQAIQWPLVELSTQEEMLRLLILRTAVEMDDVTAQAKQDGKAPWVAIEKRLGHKIGMCNYYANRLACEAADRAMQIHGGDGYSRHYPFEHIWRHFKRYRITEGSEEVQMRKIAAYLFGYKNTAIIHHAKSRIKAFPVQQRADDNCDPHHTSGPQSSNDYTWCQKAASVDSMSSMQEAKKHSVLLTDYGNKPPTPPGDDTWSNSQRPGPRLSTHAERELLSDNNVSSSCQARLPKRRQKFPWITGGFILFPFYHFIKHLSSRETLFDLQSTLGDQDRAQGAIMLTYRTISFMDMKPLYWLSIATHYAKSADAHRYHEKQDTREGALLKRLWWCCVLRDRILALALRQSPLLSPTAYNCPELSVADFAHEIGTSRVYDGIVKRLIVQIAIALGDLGTLLSEIPPAPSLAKVRELCRDEIEDLTMRLDKWYDETYAMFRLPTLITGAHESLILFSNVLCTYYQ